MRFFHSWFSVRGLSKQLHVPGGQTPRIHISVPLRKLSIARALSTDSELWQSSLDEIDVQFEGSLGAGSSSSSLSESIRCSEYAKFTNPIATVAASDNDLSPFHDIRQTGKRLWLPRHHARAVSDRDTSSTSSSRDRLVFDVSGGYR